MKTQMTLALAAAVLALASAGATWAAGAPAVQVAASSASAAALTAGEVRKVDAAQAKVTIKHEAIANLDMPAMTMVFRASKPELLKDLKAGDKIRFRAESNNGLLVVTQIEVAK